MARMGKVRVLVVDDDKKRFEVFQRCLGADFDVVEARPGQSATRLLENEDFDLLSDKRGSAGMTNSLAEFVGSCPSTRSLLDTIERVAREDGDFLILGEAGSGKTRVARAIHQERRQTGAFLCLRLAELDARQIESAVFDKGMSQELQSGPGTLFIDGIQHVSLAAQNRLVRERSSIWPGWRVIFGAPSLSEELSHPLREHLAQREVQIRPLRERGEDIPELAVHFVAKACKALGRHGISISREAMAELCAYNWPGNVCELRDVIEQAVPRCSDMGQIGAGLISAGQNAIVEQVVEDIIGGSRGLDAAMAELEVAVIREALQQQHGNRSAAARQLKLPRQTLQDRMKKYGLWQPQ